MAGMDINSSQQIKRTLISKNFTKEKQLLIQAHLIEALQILHRSVVTRKVRESLGEMKNGEKYGAKRI